MQDTTFVTGACGFVGLALAEHLLARGGTVFGYDRALPPAAALAAFAALPGRFVMLPGDVTDAATLADAMQRHRPARLVTLAAITADARREQATPGAIAAVNVAGTWNALAAAAASGVQRVVHGSSGSVYGASGAEPVPLQEDRTPQRPEGLYGISKQAAEAGASRLAALYRLDLTIGRIGTCFGPYEGGSDLRDTPSAPLQVLRLAERGAAVRLPREGRRDWLYVRDAAAALVALLDAPRLPRPVYHLAAGFEWSVADWCRRLATDFPGLDWRLAAPGETSGVDYHAPYDRASMDIRALRADTGFMPRFDLPAAADDYLAWRRRYP
ncbi:NAD-dependent epimerase/dehydratase family protein [Xylophilus sp. Kf1]|nr:NAD-dependent epimerase/dehydratase family protein [Xylophilus sp. Kf1]